MRVSYFLIFIATFSIQSFAFQSRDEAGLGFTDNANLSSSDKKSDFYWKAQTNNQWRLSDQDLRFRAGYYGYSKAHEDDFLYWRAGDKFTLTRDWLLYGGLFGNDYVHHSPGITDEAFSNIGAEIYAERLVDFDKRHRLRWGPGYEFRRYVDLSKRTDQTLHVDATFEYETSPVLMFDSFAEAAEVISDQSDYNRFFFDISGGVDYSLRRDWSWYTALDYRHTAFSSRTATTVTVTSQSRGRGPAKGETLTTLEAYENLQLLSKITHRLDRTWSAGGQVTLESQSSVSGFATYTAMGIYGFVRGDF
jgi:hypothetical protein